MAKLRHILWPVVTMSLAIYFRDGMLETRGLWNKHKSRVTYKETTICETTPGVKSYAGYISIPPTPLQPFPQNLFFWFFESRNNADTAPFALWVNGGPGSGSADQAVSLNGPCLTNPDGNSTRLNPWSWNNDFNLLYIDQPVQSGFSYDVPTPGVKNMRTAEIVPGAGADIPEGDGMQRKGLFGSQNLANMPNTTALAAKSISKFLQLWFDEFAQYHRDNISLWTWSYGGYFGPEIAATILADKDIALRSEKPGHHIFGVDAFGCFNCLIDLPIQGPQLAKYPMENTLGLELYNASFAAEVDARAATCLEQARQCEESLIEVNYDPLTGAAVPDICFESGICWGGLSDTFEVETGRNPFDLGTFWPDGFPQTSFITLLSQDWVVEHLGAKVNYVEVAPSVDMAFVYTGDAMLSRKKTVEGLLDAGVQVALVYGDRDFRSDWIGGEKLSLALNYAHSTSFRSAGYAPVTTTKSNRMEAYVRQAGPLSFTRVLDSGHMIPYYRPEMAHDIFNRVSQGWDVATGTKPMAKWAASTGSKQMATKEGEAWREEEELEEYSTSGLESTWHIKNIPPAQAPEWCNPNWAPLSFLCTDPQIQALADGTAVVLDGVVVEPHQGPRELMGRASPMRIGNVGT